MPIRLISTTPGYVSPPDLTRDARQPHPVDNNNLAARQGIGSPSEPIGIKLTVCGNLKPQCFQLCEMGQEPLDTDPVTYLSWNQIVSLTPRVYDPYRYDIVLAHPIAAGYWTGIKYWSGSKKVSYGYLPGDINGDSIVNSADVDRLTACTTTPGLCPAPYRRDIDHAGGSTVENADLTALNQLLAGTGSFVAWNGKTLPTNACSQTGGGGGPYCPAMPCDGGGGGGEEAQSATMAGGLEEGPVSGEENEGLEEDPEAGLSENQRLVNGFVSLLTESDPVGAEELGLFYEFVETMTAWCMQNLGQDEEFVLVQWLSDPERVYASVIGQNAASDVIAALMP